MARRLNRGDVHLYQFGSPDKRRPVVVLTRGSLVGHLTTVTVAPVTSVIRGVPSQVILDESDGMKGPCAVNLHNIAAVPQHLLGRRVATLSDGRMHEVCVALRYSVGCD